MTEKVFWQDPYRTELDARVVACEGDTLALDRTIFFALSGGQESDRGTIGGATVLEARKVGADILYRLAPGHGLAVGKTARIRIDWPRRYRLMRLHFAAEIVLELATRALPDAAKIGAHIAEEKARIDFAHPENVAPLLPGLAAQAAAIVASDQAIVCGFSDVAAERRFWKVREFAEVPCGGTHVRRTGEIGTIALKRRNVGKGKERIEITVDDRPPPPSVVAD